MSDAPQVLVIDDEPATVRLLVELLRGHGIRLRVALAAEEPTERATGTAVPVVAEGACRPTTTVPVPAPSGADAAPEAAEGSRADRLLEHWARVSVARLR
ncbi:MAG: hypothetical protein LJE69_15540 [Thiohalocapsa sp.]|uniref:hypothetical protein n=1 Tax=Thiohalocapsa sp. TaxID=2497641 RepID=UPI0025FD3914|nr:hypothetical protein [Thiohalocapsa sp.]MCG6942653.1 hypothetical protein [Thiohalocapsa sp.]